MFAALPLSLLALLFASPVLSATNESSNDPFRALALHKPKQPENPICCLKPLTPPEPVDDGILLSFEEWKMKQLASEAVNMPNLDEKNTSNGIPFIEDHAGSEHSAPSSGGSTDSPTPPSDDTPSLNSAQTLSGPQFRVPLTDRFNYASLDCSARVHTAHRSAKSPASILSSKKDRYMLSPCDKSKEKQFVVVELCDDIRIDTVQLANFEFFSGVFKDFTVSVSKTYTTDPDDWTLVSTYRAKNVRGVQSFRWPTSLRDFYRFIRIDFLSHYGNEYYCPVSLLRVYGLTHLEEWKWDVWDSESRTKQAELQRNRMLTLPAVSVPDAPSTAVIVQSAVISSETDTQKQPPPAEQNEKAPQPDNTSQNSAVPSQYSDGSNLKSLVPENDISESKSTPPVNEPKISPASETNTMYHSTGTYISSSPAVIVPSSSIPPENANIPMQTSISQPSASPTSNTPAASTTEVNSSTSPMASPQAPNSPSSSPDSSPSTATATPSSNGTPTPTTIIVIPSSTTPSATPSSAVMPVIPPPQVPHVPPPAPSFKQPSSGGGESIYRTILNKLAEVELNQTLYMRYIEQQNSAVREVIRRLGEDVGRLEGISRAQSMTYQRTMDDWDRQRYQLEMEYGELISRIEYLSEEIVLEKRLGVAQLLLLLAVLVFLGLTRGSRAETTTLFDQSGRSVREWGRRHLRLSGDWAGRFRGKNTSVETERRGSESTSTSRSRTRTATVGPRTPSPLRPEEKKLKSAKHYPPHLPLGLQSSYDEDHTVLSFPSTSQPYLSKSERNKQRQRPLEPISLNTAPISSSSSFIRSETRHSSNNRQQTTSNPRSRAPSLRSTPRRTHQTQYQFIRPVTPTSSATFLHQQLRPQLLQRSSSHGMGVPPSASWGSSGVGLGGVNDPKSAKKWARTAHLHEVKIVPPLRNKKSVGEEMKGGGERVKGKEKERTPRVFEFDGDMFSTSKGRPNEKSLQTVEMDTSAGPSRPPSNSLLFKSPAPGQESLSSAAEVVDDADGDGDTWVDTDSVGGSELDADVEGDEDRFVGIGPGAGVGGSSSVSSSSPRGGFGVAGEVVGSGLRKPPLIPFPEVTRY